eukprot:4373083-Prorocentrum_lima.AAC.1
MESIEGVPIVLRLLHHDVVIASYGGENVLHCYYQDLSKLGDGGGGGGGSQTTPVVPTTPSNYPKCEEQHRACSSCRLLCVKMSCKYVRFVIRGVAMRVVA